jgi:nitrite reductase/ring-hydroxylating ferredoxin subunit
MAKHKVCKTSELKVGERHLFKAANETVLVFHLEDGFYATQPRCSHVFAPLKSGKIVDGDKIQCPLHRAQFDIRTGEVCKWAHFPPGIQLLNVVRGEKSLTTYPVTVENGEVFVDI